LSSAATRTPMMRMGTTRMLLVSDRAARLRRTVTTRTTTTTLTRPPWRMEPTKIELES